MSHCTEIAARICEQWDRSDAAERQGAGVEADSCFHALLTDTERLSRLPARDLGDVLAQLVVVAEASCTIADEEQGCERLRMAAEALDRFIRSAVPVLEAATCSARPKCLNRYVDLHDRLLARSANGVDDAQRYRKEAEATRQLIETVEHAVERVALLEIAEEWDALAARLEKEQSGGGEN